MRTIICKKCGAVIDASLGECPVCGAVYYILPEDAAAAKAAGQQKDAQPTSVHDPGSFKDKDIDDIFNTHTFKPVEKAPAEEDIDATRAFSPVTPAESRSTRPAAPTPTRSGPASPSGSSGDYGGGGYSGGGPGQDNNGKRKLVIWAIALLALLTLVLTIMSGAFNFSSNASEKETMDNVVGQTEETATALLEGKGLVVNSEYEYNEETKGTVIAQSIKEGKTIKEGQSVTLTVSSGPKETDTGEPEVETATVPSLTGKTYDQALYETTAAGLLIAMAEGEYDDTVPEGSVISQSPAAGTVLNEGDMVTITVSKGPEPSPSPENVITITSLSGTGGDISPKGLVDVEEGGEVTFTITPDDGYSIKEVKVDGSDVGAVTTYTFSNVTDSHTIYAVFSLDLSTDDAG